MAKFKIDDTVKIKAVDSTDSIYLNGQIGKIVDVKSTELSGRETNYYLLDIELNRFGNTASGIWQYELSLVEKQLPKVMGFVKFLESIERK